MTKRMPPPECYRCHHLRPDSGADSRACDAFPQGIPDPILYGVQKSDGVTDSFVRVLHRELYPGQTNDIVFSPA